AIRDATVTGVQTCALPIWTRVALTPIPPLSSKSIWQLLSWGYADYQSARPTRPPRRRRKREGAGAPRESAEARCLHPRLHHDAQDRKSTRLNSSHGSISYA